jgi:L-ascorbate metabolism protein UlaG (beta-lactamase superfamily)
VERTRSCLRRERVIFQFRIFAGKGSEQEWKGCHYVLLKTRHPDVALLYINGITGNMDAHDAALMAWQLGAGLLVPIYHYLWAVTTGTKEETLNPELFVGTFERLGGPRRLIPAIGEEIDLVPQR